MLATVSSINSRISIWTHSISVRAFRLCPTCTDPLSVSPSMAERRFLPAARALSTSADAPVRSNSRNCFVKLFLSPLTTIPVEYPVASVSVSVASRILSFTLGRTWHSSVSRNLEPICTPAAPISSAAAMPLPSAIPPPAIAGLPTCGIMLLSCTYPGLLLLQPVFFDQLPTQKLTNGGLGQPIPEFHFLGHLVRSQPFLTEINYFLFGRSLPLLQHHKSLDGFTAICVGYSCNHRFLYLGMLKQHLIYFSGIDVISRSANHVLLPVYNVKIPLFIHPGHIARTQPTI